VQSMVERQGCIQLLRLLPTHAPSLSPTRASPPRIATDAQQPAAHLILTLHELMQRLQHGRLAQLRGDGMGGVKE
jgi:hypothetical protein